MADKTKTGPTATEDLLDQMVAEDRMNQRARKELYREQLQQDMQQHSRQKQLGKITSQMELEQLYNNMRRAEDLERTKHKERMKVEREVQLVNKAMLDRTKQPGEPIPNGKSLSDQLNEHNQIIKQTRKQRQSIQDEMNSMQQKVLTQPIQIKREQEQRRNSQRLFEQQQHLQQMESYVEKRQRDKQNRLERHRQNMRVFQEIGKLQGNQDKQKDFIQEKFQSDRLAEMRLRAFEEKSQQQRRQKQQLWRRGVERQLQEMQQVRQAMGIQKKQQRKLMDSINIMEANHKDTAYLRELEIQIEADKNRRQRERNERYGVHNESPTYMSPALLGKIPTSYDRQKQLEHIDRNLGYNSMKRTEVAQSFTPRIKMLSREDLTQHRQMLQLKEKLNMSRDYNTARQAVGVGTQDSYRSNPISPRVEKAEAAAPLTMPQEENNGLKSRTSARSGSPQADQPTANRMSRSMRMYDFISGRNIVFNLEQ